MESPRRQPRDRSSDAQPGGDAASALSCGNRRSASNRRNRRNRNVIAVIGKQNHGSDYTASSGQVAPITPESLSRVACSRRTAKRQAPISEFSNNVSLSAWAVATLHGVRSVP